MCPRTWHMILCFPFRRHLPLYLQLLPLRRHFRLIPKSLLITPVLYRVCLFPGSDNRLFVKRVKCNVFWVAEITFWHRLQFDRLLWLSRTCKEVTEFLVVLFDASHVDMSEVFPRVVLAWAGDLGGEVFVLHKEVFSDVFPRNWLIRT